MGWGFIVILCEGWSLMSLKRVLWGNFDMRLCMVTSEFYPLIRSGGLGDMVGSLCEDLRRRYGYEIRVILPKYEGVEGGVWS